MPPDAPTWLLVEVRAPPLWWTILRPCGRARNCTFIVHLSAWKTAGQMVFSFPDPTFKEGKGLVCIECLLGLVSEFCHANQIHAMWFTCDDNVTLRNSHLVLHMRAVDALPCQNDASSCQSHDMLHPACPKRRSMYTRPFPSSRAGSGNETSQMAV